MLGMASALNMSPRRSAGPLERKVTRTGCGKSESVSSSASLLVSRRSRREVGNAFFVKAVTCDRVLAAQFAYAILKCATNEDSQRDASAASSCDMCRNPSSYGSFQACAGMAELADAADSKSAEVHPSWGFDPPSRHQARKRKYPALLKIDPVPS